MNGLLVLQGVIELVLSLFTAIFIYFTGFKIFSVLTKSIEEVDELKKNNIAVGILITSFIIGVMLLVKAAVGPAMDTLSVIFKAGDAAIGLYLFAILRILIFYLISAVFSFIILWGAMKLFMVLTGELDEMEEIKNNNSATALLVGMLIISIAVILQHPLTTMLNSLVAAPAVNENVAAPLINTPVLLQGVVELVISLFGAIFVFFFSLRMFSMLTKNIDEMQEIKNNNIAVSIMAIAFIFSVMLLIKAAIAPANEAFGYAVSTGGDIKILLFTVLRIIVFFILAACFSFIMLFLAMKFFMLLTTNIDEMAQIKNNNVAIALLIAVLVISTAILLEHGLGVLLSGLIKAPELGKGLLDLSNM